MIPLALASAGEKQKIQKISGNDKVRQHLLELGLVMGATVTVILAVGESRVAIGADLARRIMV